MNYISTTPPPQKKNTALIISKCPYVRIWKKQQSHTSDKILRVLLGLTVMVWPLCPSESSSEEYLQSIFWLSMGYFFVLCAYNDGIMVTMKAVTLHTPSVCILCKFDQFFFSIISTIIGIPLSAISRSAALRVFFFLRLRSSLAVSKISQTYVTSVLIDPSLESQIETLEKLLSSGVNYSSLSYLTLCYISYTDYLSTGILTFRNRASYI
jgi:hypothetical protein